MPPLAGGALSSFLLAIMLASGAAPTISQMVGHRFAEKERQDNNILSHSFENHTVLGDISDVIVSLTTLPMRMDILKVTIEALLLQTVRVPILVAFPRAFVRFPGIDATSVPQWLADLESEGVQVVRCEDRGPATKLLCALHLTESGFFGRSDARIITVDDDMVGLFFCFFASSVLLSCI